MKTTKTTYASGATPLYGYDDNGNIIRVYTASGKLYEEVEYKQVDSPSLAAWIEAHKISATLVDKKTGLEQSVDLHSDRFIMPTRASGLMAASI